MKILNTSVSSWDFSWKNNVHIKNQETVVKSGSEDWERILVWVRVKPEIILDKHISWWFVVSNEVIRQYFDLNTTSISSSTSLKRHSAGRREKIINVNWRPLLLSPLLSSPLSIPASIIPPRADNASLLCFFVVAPYPTTVTEPGWAGTFCLSLLCSVPGSPGPCSGVKREDISTANLTAPSLRLLWKKVMK